MPESGFATGRGGVEEEGGAAVAAAGVSPETTKAAAWRRAAAPAQRDRLEAPSISACPHTRGRELLAAGARAQVGELGEDDGGREGFGRRVGFWEIGRAHV